MTSQPTTLARIRRLLTRLLQAIVLDRPEYRGPCGEYADDEETARPHCRQVCGRTLLRETGSKPGPDPGSWHHSAATTTEAVHPVIRRYLPLDSMTRQL